MRILRDFSVNNPCPKLYPAHRAHLTSEACRNMIKLFAITSLIKLFTCESVFKIELYFPAHLSASEVINVNVLSHVHAMKKPADTTTAVDESEAGSTTRVRLRASVASCWRP